MKPKIVKFKNGTYGIRKWSFSALGYIFMDLNDYGFWCDSGSRYFNDCRGTKEKAEDAFNLVCDLGTPIPGEDK